MDDNFTIHMFGVPFFSAGTNPKAVIAVGLQPTGIVAVGIISVGVIAVGQLSFGIFTFGQLTSGIACIGQLAVGLFVLGQVGLGIFAGFGQGAAGFISNGAGFYKINVNGTTKETINQIKRQIKKNPNPLIYWTLAWSTVIFVIIYYLPSIRRYISFLHETVF